MLKEIRLYGWLGEKYGKVHHYAVNSVGEAVRALQANFPSFAQDIIEYKPGYRVWAGTTRLKTEEVPLPISEKEIIRISPVIAGSGDDGFIGIIIGVGLMWVTGGLSGIGLAGNGWLVGSTLGNFIGSIGLSLVLGGIAQLLAPTPDAPEPNESPDNMPSYLFRGAVNTTAQGHPVPIGYGRLIIGSAVVSAGISTTDS